MEFLVAQFVGIVGYGLYMASPYFKTRIQMLLMEMFGCLVLCLHFYLIDATLLVYSNMIWIYMGLAGIAKTYSHKAGILFFLGYGMIFIMSWATWEGQLVDYTVFLGLCVALTAKLHTDLGKFSGYSLTGGCLSATSCALIFSLPGIVFNSIFAAGHALNLIKIYRKHLALQPARIRKNPRTYP